MTQPTPEPNATTRQCPTRVGGGDALIAHTIPTALCGERQAGHYHKCSTCAHCDGASGAPIPVRTLAPQPAPRPARSVAAG